MVIWGKGCICPYILYKHWRVKENKNWGCFLYGNGIYYNTCSREQGVHTSLSDEQKRLK